MTDLERYETEDVVGSNPKNALLLSFVSKGIRDINKLVAYSDIGRQIDFPHKGPLKLYNLGFGDQKGDSLEIDDKADSNNGDMRIVFNTVLHTVPIFFEKYPKSSLFVSGSDSKRTKIYNHFVSKRYETFKEEYTFYGLDDNKRLRDYAPFEEYLGIVFLRK